MTLPVAALTGASGFLGRRLAYLLRQDSWRVRVLVRRPLDMKLWDGSPPELVEGHLADQASLERLTSDVDLAIHCAGAVSARNRAAYFAANADGAGNMARAMAATSSARMVLVSSLAAREPQLSSYAASKEAGELAARAALAPERLVVVRPPAIYGPGDRATVDVFKLAAKSPFLPVLDAPAARMALAHVDDVAAEILRLARAPDAPALAAIGGARPQGYGWREIMTAAARAVGREPRLVAVPPGLVTGAAHVSGLLGKITNRPLVFSPGKAREMLHGDWSVSSRELAPGALPAHFTLDEGFADTVAWYRAKAWL